VIKGDWGESNQNNEMGTKVEKRGIFNDAGYRKLVLWTNVYELRKMVYEMTKSFEKAEYRRTSQMRDAARSAKQNIQEGYRHKSRKTYLHYLGIAHASLHELAGDIEDCFDDELISDQQFEKVSSLIGRTDYLFRRTIDGLNGTKVNKSSPLITPNPA
jgi:four helix bundle protein